LGTPLGNQRMSHLHNLHLSLGNILNYERTRNTWVSQTLGKIEPSDDEIRNWMKQGWKFTQRTRKGHIYITRRLGANKERSLGPYSPLLWDRLEKIKHDSSKPQTESDSLSLFYSLVELNRASQYSQTCVNRDNEGYYTYWRWSPDYNLLNYRGDLKLKEVREE